MPIGQLKVAVDSKFKNYGKELRKLGADVIILQDPDSIDQAVEVIFFFYVVQINIYIY